MQLSEQPGIMQYQWSEQEECIMPDHVMAADTAGAAEPV